MSNIKTTEVLIHKLEPPSVQLSTDSVIEWLSAALSKNILGSTPVSFLADSERPGMFYFDRNQKSLVLYYQKHGIPEGRFIKNVEQPYFPTWGIEAFKQGLELIGKDIPEFTVEVTLPPINNKQQDSKLLELMSVSYIPEMFSLCFIGRKVD